MTEVLNVISIVAGILFSLTGAFAAIVSCIPTLRHKALRRAAVALQPHLSVLPPLGLACENAKGATGAIGPNGAS